MTSFNLVRNVYETPYSIFLPSEFQETDNPKVAFSVTPALGATPHLIFKKSAEFSSSPLFYANPSTVTVGPTVVDLTTPGNDCTLVQGRTDSYSSTGIYLRMGLERTNGVSIGYYKAWIPFTVSLAQGTSIVSATLKVVGTAGWDDVSIKLGCENTANAVNPANYTDLNSRVMTGAFTIVDAVDDFVLGTIYSFDVTPAVQEILNLPAWVSGNKMAVLCMRGTTNTIGYRNFASSTNPTYDAPVLEITY